MLEVAQQASTDIHALPVVRHRDGEVGVFGAGFIAVRRVDHIARFADLDFLAILEDFRDQLQQMKDMGGISAMLDKLPGMGGLAQAAQQRLDVKQFVRMEAIINSMTPRERRDPDMLNGSRKRRITQGSGTTIQDLNRLMKQHKQMQTMMKQMGNKGFMQNMMRGLGAMVPPGGGGFPRR